MTYECPLNKKTFFLYTKLKIIKDVAHRNGHAFYQFHSQGKSDCGLTKKIDPLTAMNLMIEK